MPAGFLFGVALAPSLANSLANSIVRHQAGETKSNSHGKSRDEDRMLHPDLITWEELSEADRDKDRDNVLQIRSLAAMRGQKICLTGS